MKKNLALLSAFSLAGLVVLSFQNCAKTKFSDQASTFEPPAPPVQKTCQLNFTPDTAQVDDVIIQAPTTLTYILPDTINKSATYECEDGKQGSVSSLEGNIEMQFGRTNKCTFTYFDMENKEQKCDTTMNVSCSREIIRNAYETSTETFNVAQKDIAVGPDGNGGCIDGAVGYAGNLNMSAGEGRFRYTCVSRYCQRKYNDSAAVGEALGATVVDANNQLDLNSSIQIKCRANKAVTSTPPNNICAVTLNQDKPLESFNLGFNDSRCGFCGCDPATVSSKWSNDGAQIKACATAYCQDISKDSPNPYRWGILVEWNYGGYAIKCSRAGY